MKTTPRFAPLAPFMLAIAAGGALAETDRQPSAIEHLAQAVAETARAVAFADDETMAFAAGELGQERVAKNAPYCADAVHETVQWLPDADGGPPNRIVNRQTTRLCRDGEGRTRQEVERGNRKLVYLRDPVSRESWVLDPQRKTARRLASPTIAWRGEIGFDQSLWRDYAEQMRQWAREVARSMRDSHRLPAPPQPPAVPVPPAPATPAAPAVAPTPPSPPPAPVVIHRGDGEREVRVLRLPGDATPWPALPGLGALPMPPGVSWRAQALAPRGPGVVTPLPAKEIEGVRANGERTTWTIEAGKLGNERPIQIVREVWTSPELLLTLATRNFDPRTGEVNYRLVNLKRGEPDAALMRVPPDYASSRGTPAPRAPSAPTRG